MNWISRLHARHHWLVGGGILLVTLVCSIGFLRLQFDGDPRVMFRSSSKAFARLEEFRAQFGPDDNECWLIVEGDDLLTLGPLLAMRDLVSAIAVDEDIESVLSMFSVRKAEPVVPTLLIPGDLTEEKLLELRNAILEHPLVRGNLMSRDGRVAAINVRFHGGSLDVEQLDQILSRLARTADEHLTPHRLTYGFAGHPSIRIATLKTLRSEVARFAYLGMLISAVIALFVFRNLAMILVALSGPAAGVFWTLGLMGWLGIRIDPLLVVLPTLLFVVGFTDAFHLLNEIRHLRTSGASRREAAAAAVRVVGPACALTALTTAIGFASLAVARTECTQRFGLTSALGTVVMFTAVQALVPWLAASQVGNWLPTTGKAGNYKGISFLLPAYSRMLRWPRLVTALSILIAGICLLISFQLRSDLRWVEMLPRASATVRISERCNAALGGLSGAYVVVKWPQGLKLNSPEVLDALDDVHGLVENAEPLNCPVSLLTVLQSLQWGEQTAAMQARHLKRFSPQVLDRFLQIKGRQLLVSMHVPDVGAAVLKPRYDELRQSLQLLEAKHPGFDFEFTGTMVVAAENVFQIINDMSYSLSVASLVIFLVMVALFRSLSLGLLCVIPNILPQLLTAAFMVLYDEPLTITSVLAFCLCLGLSVDDTVHFLMRFLEERRANIGDREAIERTFASAGGTMIATSLVLMGGFASMLVSQMPGIQWFAILSCITLVAALVGDLIMLPALLLCARLLPNANQQLDASTP